MLFAAVHESAFGTKQTFLFAPQISAIGGKADIAFHEFAPFARTKFSMEKTMIRFTLLLFVALRRNTCRESEA
jgi:hypothetical protein